MNTPIFSPSSLAAARTFIMLVNEPDVLALAKTSPEFYRAVIDIARGRKLHNVKDGTAEYLMMVDALEVLCTATF